MDGINLKVNMENLFYSNVLIDSQQNWRTKITEWIGEAPVNFKLVKITRSKHWLVQISSATKSELVKVLDKAIEQ